MTTDALATSFALQCLTEHIGALLSELASLKRNMRPEWVHSTRVRSRRTRAALEAFRDIYPAAAWRPLYDQVRWLTSALGALREREVSLRIYRELTAGGDLAENLCREYLELRLSRRQRRVRAEVEERLRAVAIPRLRGLAEHLLGGRLKAPVHARRRTHGTGREPAQSQPTLFSLGEDPLERARSVLAARIAPVLEFSRGSRLRRATDRQLHELRITTKKLRYIMEIFDSVWPAGLRTPIARARGVQDAIGVFHDWCVVQERVEREIARAQRQDASHLVFQLGRLLAQIAQRKAELRREIGPRVKALDAVVRALLPPRSAPVAAGTLDAVDVRTARSRPKPA